jgi:hypothetical protein
VDLGLDALLSKLQVFSHRRFNAFFVFSPETFRDFAVTLDRSESGLPLIEAPNPIAKHMTA